MSGVLGNFLYGENCFFCGTSKSSALIIMMILSCIKSCDKFSPKADYLFVSF